MSGSSVSIRDESTNAMLPVNVSTRGNFVGTSEGAVSAGTSLNAATANGTGTVIDFGSACQSFSFVVTTTGSPTGGTVTLSLSVDGTTFVATTTTATVGSSAALASLSGVAARYARLDLTGLTGGTSPTVTAKVMGF